MTVNRVTPKHIHNLSFCASLSASGVALPTLAVPSSRFYLGRLNAAPSVTQPANRIQIETPRAAQSVTTKEAAQGGNRERFVSILPPDKGALPTLYQGTLYRSRTEARYACFFDHMGIEFLYEPQGFQIDSGTCYLPDFFLPKTRTWAEVKPTEFSTEERRKLEGVADQKGRPALFLVGHPDFKAYEIVFPRDVDIADPFYSTTVLDIEGIGQRAYSKGQWFTEVPTEWIVPEFFSEEYRRAVFEARTNRFDSGGRW